MSRAVDAPANRARSGGAFGVQTAERSRALVSYLIAAVVCYVPVLLTKPGVVSDDTKTYLYYDPGRYTKAAASIFDPSIALGTVTHENVGYLFPMGPFFWLFASIHVPVWVAQRIFFGSILFAAAAGVLYLCKVLEIGGAARVAAALAYGLSPYVMQYAGRISVILLPFSGLGWMLAFMVLAVRYRGWRYPALFAFVVAVVSGINATAVLYIGVGPVLYLAYATFVSRELSGRDAWSVFWRTGVLTLLASLWWIVGLSIEGLYGVDVLKYTESVSATSSASSASEVVRGLGYWYFYGGDRLGIWQTASEQLTGNAALLAASYLVPLGAVASAAFVRFRHRAFFVILVAVGLVLSVGAHPFGAPTPFGVLDKAFMTRTTVGLALRSTDRATPLVILGLAVLLGVGIAALVEWLRAIGLAVASLAGLAVLAGNAPLLAGESVISQFSQPASPPSYVLAAARYLNSRDRGTRVYSLPGDNFAAYDFGDTIDPIWPAVLTRPYVVHEQQIYGSMETANLLYALDNPLQEGVMDWRALAPIARLMSVGNVIVEYDQGYERYDSPRPTLLEEELATTPSGLRDKVSFGKPSANSPKPYPMLDETYFDLPPGEKKPHPLVVYTVADPRSIIRAESLSDPLVVDGDDVGVVEAADDGLLGRNPTVLLAGTLDENRALEREVAGGSADLVLTDSNRREAYEWNSLQQNIGFTETATGGATASATDDPGFDLFPGSPISGKTVTVLAGVKSVRASSYGVVGELRAEDAPSNAIDGNLATSWQTQGTASKRIVGQWWQVTTTHPVTADSVRLTQPVPKRNEAWLTNQHITKVTLTFDGKDPETVELGPGSRTKRGQLVTFPKRRFSTLRIRIDKTNYSYLYAPPVGASLVGFSEVQLANVVATPIVKLPSDLLDHLGRSSLKDRLSILLERERVAPVPPRSDPETSIIREWSLPEARSFALTGTAHLSTEVSDETIDRLVGRRPSGPGDPVTYAESSSRMPGNLDATASVTLDGKDSTVWMPGEGSKADVNSFLVYGFKRPLTVDHLALSISSDKEHSVPTTVVVSAGGVSRVVELPKIPVTRRSGSVTTVGINFEAVTGSRLELRFSHVAVRKTLSYETSLDTALPIGVAEVDIPGAARETLPAELPSLCRSNLLEINGRRVYLRLTGSTASALEGGPLRVSLCGPDASGIRLSGGKTVLEAADGALTGMNLDELALDSAPGGGAGKVTSSGQLTSAAPAATPSTARAKVLSGSSTEMHLEVRSASRPFMLVLGESYDHGWTASVDGKSLGTPVLVDGFANGWRITTKTLSEVAKDGSFQVTLSFAPQRELDWALVISAATVLLCLAVAIFSLIWRRRRRRYPDQREADASRPGRDPAVPALVSPLGEASPRAGPFGCGIAVVASGALAFFMAGPTVGVVVAVAVVAMLAWRRGRTPLVLGSALAMAVGVSAVVVIQVTEGWAPGAGWPSHFQLPSEIIWIAVALMSADACVEILRERRASPRRAGSR